MGGQHGIGGRYEGPPPTPVVVYNVTGTITPNATCNYVPAGTAHGKTYYRRNDSLFFIWWSGVATWIISDAVDRTVNGWWGRNNANIVGNYTEHAPATGTATVALGPH